jgi:adenosine deaminase
VDHGGVETGHVACRYVGVNFVAPEDALVVLRDYHLHMQMIDYLHTVYPGAHITLHAGELVPGLAAPEDLRSHIRDAITTAHAERIGHGVEVAGEDNPDELLRSMAARHVLVGITLTSNCQIVPSLSHPTDSPTYGKCGLMRTLTGGRPRRPPCLPSSPLSCSPSPWCSTWPKLRSARSTS